MDTRVINNPLTSGASGVKSESTGKIARSNRSSISLKADTKALAGLFAALKEMDKEANDWLRDEVKDIAIFAAQQIKMGAYGSEVLMSGQSHRIAETVRGRRDRVPNVVIGGSRIKFSGGAVSGMVVMGNEWGSGRKFPNGGRRYPFPLTKGNWIFPTVRAIQPDITHRWKRAVTHVLHNWTKGPGGGM